MSRIIYDTDSGTPLPSPRFPTLRYPPAPTPPLNSHPPFFAPPPRVGTPSAPQTPVGEDDDIMSPLPSPQRPHRLRRMESAPSEEQLIDGVMGQVDRGNVGGIEERVEGSEIPALERMHRTNGYRDGIAQSKEKYVQEGFDEGYSLGAVLGLRVGYILGGIEGIVRALGTDGRGEAKSLLDDARKQLDLRMIFGKDYFDEEGIWKYPVSGQDEDVTFQEVSESHPLIQKWDKILQDFAQQWNVDFGVAEERWGGMEGREEEG